jgi:hypothetical protein
MWPPIAPGPFPSRFAFMLWCTQNAIPL